VNKATQTQTDIPTLAEAKPLSSQQLSRLQQLALRIYGLMTWDLPGRADALVAAAGPGLKKKGRQALLKSLNEELPVLLLIHAVDRLNKDQRLIDQELVELMHGLLLPCFSLCYLHLYQEPADPLKHVLARLDWYLDGDKGDSLSAFAHLAATILGKELKDPAPLLAHLEEELLPEMDQRYELAFRYEFS
jgi:hypothetical protein